MPPERPARRTHPDSSIGGSGDGGKKNGVGGGSSTGRDNDLRCRWPRGAATADVMMTMAGEGDGEATVRRLRGEYKAPTMQQGCEGNRLWCAGGRGSEAINKRITNNINNK